MNSPSSEQLQEQIRNGDALALGQYIELVRPRLMGFLRRVTGEHLQRVMDLDDLLQEVAAAAVEALPRIPKQDLEIDRWLEQLARRRVVDAHRKHFGAAKRNAGRNQVFSQFSPKDDGDPGIEQLLIASMTSPSMAVSREWRIGRLRTALSQLSEEQQRLIEWRFGQGLASQDIAERLNKSDVAVRVALSRTLKTLEAMLQDRSSSQ